MMNPAHKILYIDTADELDRFCDTLRAADWIALDTEFLREKTYYPKLCLLQLATAESVACIDPLALDDLAPLLDILFDEGITKVMHSGRQDMEIFYHLAGKLPSPVFDTQIAALMLGYPEQVGYASLVKEELGIELDKLHTRADWTVRPLTDDQIQYAADDVIYLVEIYQRLCEKLAALGRRDWLLEDFKRLTNADLYNNPPGDAWQKVKGGNRLRGDSLSVMQALAGWREQLAQQKNRPKGWIVRDDALIDISRHRPASLDALGKIRGLSEGLVRNSGNKIVELVREATGTTPVPFPDKGKHSKLSPDQNALVDIMMALVRLSGEQNNLNPAVLATRKQLEKLVLGEQDTAVVQGWRRKFVGEQLLAFLNGDLKLSLCDGRLAVD
ncbi:MAG: ribonuclease D [Gammaproteobacteria bacterium]